MLSEVTIVIPTFHRRGYLRDCLRMIEENLPECEVVVVSDDGVIPQTENEIYLPYDSGLTAKRNAGVRAVHTKYTLIASDDFDFSSPDAREGVIEMEFVLKRNLDIDVVAGRVNNKPYEGYLDYVLGEYIKEHRLRPVHDSPIQVDIAANYFLARTQVLRDVPWDEAIGPIGGEHVDWFLDIKAAYKKVVFLPSANVNTFPYDAKKQHPAYREFRARCWQGHEQMMKKRNIKKYYSFDEEVR
jgi:glycosyltransferase involved in cell wall biosynthesis